MVMQIVIQTKRRSGWRVYRTLAALGVPRSVYYAWKGRDSLVDRVGTPCRVYEVLPEERAAICEFALQYTKIGYRKLACMMVDAGVVSAGESTVYRIAYARISVPRLSTRESMCRLVLRAAAQGRPLTHSI
jgi:hypothetical protein